MGYYLHLSFSKILAVWCSSTLILCLQDEALLSEDLTICLLFCTTVQLSSQEQQDRKCCEEEITFMRQMIHLVLGQFFSPSNKSLEKGKKKQWVIASFIFGVSIKINVQPHYFLKQHFVVFQNLSTSPQNSQQNL